MPESERKKAESIFNRAAGLSPVDREQLLGFACTDQPGLRAEVESLLHEFDSGTASFLKSTEHVERREAAIHTSGQIIDGKFKLLEVLGEGGLGVVWLAEQMAPVRRKVALKLVKLGMDSKQVLARFEAERNMLTMMDHPNIAQVFDAGTTETGQPFFAMEHIAGLPITAFCDGEQLTTAERLRLFVAVCRAVQHAHQRGVIHRDLKPSNILVSMRDGEPVPKVIDFGVARAMSGHLTENTLFTMQGQMLGTPEYMSPEQAEMSAVGVDSTSDIYSLGVILYELLTGVLPFDSKTLRSQGLAGISKMLRDFDAPRPSTRITTLGTDTSRVSSAHGTDPRTLRSELSGDLDWIVMRALEKNRTRRYASASEFAADIERHRHHEAVLAGPPSMTYRVSKFVRRNRTAVLAGTLVLLALVVGVIGTTLEMLKAEAAERSARLATRALADLIGLANVDLTRTPDVTIHDLLRQAERFVESEDLSDPEAKAIVSGAIGKALYAMGEAGRAEGHLRRAIAIRETLGSLPSFELYDLSWMLKWVLYDRVDSGSQEFFDSTFPVLESLLREPRYAELRGRILELLRQACHHPMTREGHSFRFHATGPKRNDYVPGSDGTRKTFRECVDFAKSTLGPEDEHAWLELADQCLFIGWLVAFHHRQVDDGLHYMQTAIRFYLDPDRGRLSGSHTRVLAAYRRLFEVGYFFGRADLAESAIKRTIAEANGVVPADNWYLLWVRCVSFVYVFQKGKMEQGYQQIREDWKRLRAAPVPAARLLEVEILLCQALRCPPLDRRKDAHEDRVLLQEHAQKVLASTLEDKHASRKQLSDIALQIAQSPHYGFDTYQDAAECARRALAMRTSRFVKTTLAAAQYRAGRFEDAIATLSECERLPNDPHPMAFAVLAMARKKLRLGRDFETPLQQLGAFEHTSFGRDLLFQSTWHEARRVCGK